MKSSMKRPMIIGISILIGLLSVGWLYPLWLAMVETVSYSQSIGVLLIERGGRPINPHEEKLILVGPAFIGFHREFAFIWASVVGFAWAFILALRLFASSHPKP